MADTGAEPKEKGVPGAPHPKARFVPRGTELKTMGDGSRMGRRDRRGRQGSSVHSNRHARVEERTTGIAWAAGKKRHSWCPPAGWASPLPGEGSSPNCPGRDSNHSCETRGPAMHTAGLGFVGRGLESSRKRMTKPLRVWEEAGP